MEKYVRKIIIPPLFPPNSLVRYPVSTIITLNVLMLLVSLTPGANIWTVFLAVIAIILSFFINNREQYIKGFNRAYKEMEQFNIKRYIGDNLLSKKNRYKDYESLVENNLWK